MHNVVYININTVLGTNRIVIVILATWKNQRQTQQKKETKFKLINLDYIYAIADEENNDAFGDEIGIENITNIEYAYTEDLSIAFQGAYFMPGDAFDKDGEILTNPEDNNAYEVMGSVKVEF